MIITLQSDNVPAFSSLSVAEVIAIVLRMSVKQGQKPKVLSKSRREKVIS